MVWAIGWRELVPYTHGWMAAFGNDGQPRNEAGEWIEPPTHWQLLPEPPA